MKYQALDYTTNEVLCETNDIVELELRMAMIAPDEAWCLRKIPSCRGCKAYADERSSVQERFDHYGITTGHWCDACYESGRYPYRKDAYDPYNECGTR